MLDRHLHLSSKKKESQLQEVKGWVENFERKAASCSWAGQDTCLWFIYVLPFLQEIKTLASSCSSSVCQQESPHHWVLTSGDQVHWLSCLALPTPQANGLALRLSVKGWQLPLWNDIPGHNPKAIAPITPACFNTSLASKNILDFLSLTAGQKGTGAISATTLSVKLAWESSGWT